MPGYTRAPRRRKTVWARWSSGVSTDANGHSFFSLWPDFLSNQVTPLGATIVRVRGMIVATHPSLIGVGVLGFKIEDYVPTLVDVNYPLTTSTGREDDWFGYVPFTYRPLANVPEAVSFDVKAMRRCDELGMAPYGYVDVGSAAGVAGIAVVGSTLVMLP